ncbi:MAG: hypothetical protein ACRD4Y_16635, partial [Candidatus Acidiferrales bacterium]
MYSAVSLNSQFSLLFLVTGSLLAALGGVMALLLFMTVRRAIGNYRAQRYDALAFTMHKKWREIVRGDIPAEEWNGNALKREIVQTIVVHEIGAAVD